MVPREIVGFDHKDFTEYKWTWWSYRTNKYEGAGAKTVRKYRRCVKSSYDGQWKVTTEYATKKSM